MQKYLQSSLAVLILSGCSSPSTEVKGVDFGGSYIELPEEKPLVKVESLTADARNVISRAISRDIGKLDHKMLKSKVRRQILRGDIDNNGLSLSDLQYAERQQIARKQIGHMSELFRSDQNGDGIVSEREFQFHLKVMQARFDQQQEQLRERYPDRTDRSDASQTKRMLDLATKYKNADTNGDKRVTLDEAYQAPYDLPRYHGYEQKYRVFETAKPLDFNGDGLIAPAEVNMAVDLFLAEAAELGIKVPSGQSSIPLSDLPSKIACDFPRPTSAAQVIRVSAYEGDQLSNVALAGQDAETTTSEIRIEPGSAPLYLIASSYESHVWRFTGAVNRVERVILSSRRKNPYGQSGVGQTGITQSKMSVSNKSCLGDDSRKISKRQQGSSMKLPEAFGNRSGKHFYFYSAGGVTLPSGSEYKLSLVRPANLKAANRPDVEAAWTSLVRFMPAGVFQFDPKKIASSSKVEKYQTLPHQAGITQLLVSGALKKSKWGGFIVRKPMRYPASLGGAHSEVFILPKGAPTPSGKPGHSCVRTSEKGPGNSGSGRRC